MAKAWTLHNVNYANVSGKEPFWTWQEWHWYSLTPLCQTWTAERCLSCFCAASGRTWCLERTAPGVTFHGCCCELQTGDGILVLLAAIKVQTCPCHPQNLQDKIVWWWALMWNVLTTREPLVKRRGGEMQTAVKGFPSFCLYFREMKSALCTEEDKCVCTHSSKIFISENPAPHYSVWKDKGFYRQCAGLKMYRKRCCCDEFQ